MGVRATSQFKEDVFGQVDDGLLVRRLVSNWGEKGLEVIEKKKC